MLVSRRLNSRGTMSVLSMFELGEDQEVTGTFLYIYLV